VHVEVLREVTDEVLEAFRRLTPQLSSSADPPDREVLNLIVASPACTLLIARSGVGIAGTLTLVMFPIPTGFRAWIEDVIVDEAARGQGIGEILTNEALNLAQAAGARTVDLTSRPPLREGRLRAPQHQALPLHLRLQMTALHHPAPRHMSNKRQRPHRCRQDDTNAHTAAVGQG
jgi:GNAT superfamily N-acetyltransferase